VSATETVVTKAAQVAQYGGAGGAVIFGLKANEFAALVGAGVAVLGLVVNLWFKYQHLKLARQAATRGKLPPEDDE
jgi:hypothetical protein